MHGEGNLIKERARPPGDDGKTNLLTEEAALDK